MSPILVDHERNTIYDVIHRWAEVQPQAPALVSYEKGPLSYGALAALSADDLGAYLSERLSGFKLPKKFIFAESIPKSDNGKVQRHKLAETFGVKIGR
jgi:acyl-CoA synthetase (AMP-forming)/AMP-acid ligase II